MKNIHKIFIFIFLFMVTSVVCFADGSELKQQLNMVCQGQNISLTGCMYTEANKNTYEKLPIGTQKMISFEEEVENKNIKGVFQGIYNAYSKLIMNPFFDKDELNDTEKHSKIKNTFLKSIEKVVNNE